MNTSIIEKGQTNMYAMQNKKKRWVCGIYTFYDMHNVMVATQN